ncbi:uncharacterized protein MKK02DRAFT_31282 [Dioszegia hungarica]|uniref:Telomere replication protein EST3 n=1 Tax=Dioszegia hungarica TaxID=4972 RepID=A0AA38HER6_9TREE|nr:uncharacterized protein MKK02DRAFT_31282 [Dioszegia hungarica]KAI9639020.1 hypothetical protein MKK02DRAFT_31282 [Dioszegia hungarica]
MADDITAWLAGAIVKFDKDHQQNFAEVAHGKLAQLSKFTTYRDEDDPHKQIVGVLSDKTHWVWVKFDVAATDEFEESRHGLPSESLTSHLRAVFRIKKYRISLQARETPSRSRSLSRAGSELDVGLHTPQIPRVWFEILEWEIPLGDDKDPEYREKSVEVGMGKEDGEVQKVLRKWWAGEADDESLEKQAEARAKEGSPSRARDLVIPPQPPVIVNVLKTNTTKSPLDGLLAGHKPIPDWYFDVPDDQRAILDSIEMFGRDVEDDTAVEPSRQAEAVAAVPSVSRPLPRTGGPNAEAGPSRQAQAHVVAPPATATSRPEATLQPNTEAGPSRQPGRPAAEPSVPPQAAALSVPPTLHQPPTPPKSPPVVVPPQGTGPQAGRTAPLLSRPSAIPPRRGPRASGPGPVPPTQPAREPEPELAEPEPEHAPSPPRRSGSVAMSSPEPEDPPYTEVHIAALPLSPEAKLEPARSLPLAAALPPAATARSKPRTVSSLGQTGSQATQATQHPRDPRARSSLPTPATSSDPGIHVEKSFPLQLGQRMPEVRASLPTPEAADPSPNGEEEEEEKAEDSSSREDSPPPKKPAKKVHKMRRSIQPAEPVQRVKRESSPAAPEPSSSAGADHRPRSDGEETDEAELSSESIKRRQRVREKKAAKAVKAAKEPKSSQRLPPSSPPDSDPDPSPPPKGHERKKGSTSAVDRNPDPPAASRKRRRPLPSDGEDQPDPSLERRVRRSSGLPARSSAVNARDHEGTSSPIDVKPTPPKSSPSNGGAGPPRSAEAIRSGSKSHSQSLSQSHRRTQTQTQTLEVSSVEEAQRPISGLPRESSTLWPNNKSQAGRLRTPSESLPESVKSQGVYGIGGAGGVDDEEEEEEEEVEEVEARQGEERREVKEEGEEEEEEEEEAEYHSEESLPQPESESQPEVFHRELKKSVGAKLVEESVESGEKAPASSGQSSKSVKSDGILVEDSEESQEKAKEKARVKGKGKEKVVETEVKVKEERGVKRSREREREREASASKSVQPRERAQERSVPPTVKRLKVETAPVPPRSSSTRPADPSVAHPPPREPARSTSFSTVRASGNGRSATPAGAPHAQPQPLAGPSLIAPTSTLPAGPSNRALAPSATSKPTSKVPGKPLVSDRNPQHSAKSTSASSSRLPTKAPRQSEPPRDAERPVKRPRVSDPVKAGGSSRQASAALSRSGAVGIDIGERVPTPGQGQQLQQTASSAPVAVPRLGGFRPDLSVTGGLGQEWLLKALDEVKQIRRLKGQA